MPIDPGTVMAAELGWNILNSLFGGSAERMASAGVDMVKLQREYLQKYWPYIESQLMRQERVAGALDPFRAAMGGYLGQMLGGPARAPTRPPLGGRYTWGGQFPGQAAAAAPAEAPATGAAPGTPSIGAAPPGWWAERPGVQEAAPGLVDPVTGQPISATAAAMAAAPGAETATAGFWAPPPGAQERFAWITDPATGEPRWVSYDEWRQITGGGGPHGLPGEGGLTPAPEAPYETGLPEAIPWFLQTPEIPGELVTALQTTPPWERPFTPEQEAALRTMGELSTQAQMSQMRQQIAQNVGRRGLGGSTLDISGNAALANWLARRRAEENARVATLGMQRGDQLRQEARSALTALEGLRQARRGEAEQKYYTGLGWLGGSVPQIGVSPGEAIGAAGNIAGTYADLSKLFGGISSQASSGIGSLLGGLFGGGGTSAGFGGGFGGGFSSLGFGENPYSEQNIWRDLFPTLR